MSFARHPVRAAPLTDPFGRAITYLRVSVTDRCDLRCVYCMPERMRFLPKDELLTFEELQRLCGAFVDLGVTKLRLTGGEPLGRKGFMGLVAGLSAHLGRGLEELSLTTNGTRLAEHAEALAGHGVRRINVSLDTLDPERFARLTRGGDLARVLAGLDAARGAGVRIKINAVALKDENEAELPDLIAWAHGHGFDVALIETMPLGEVEADRTHQFVPLDQVRETLSSFWRLTPLADDTGGPSRYVRVEETGGRLGFITPLSQHFCESCNRVRLTCTGVLYLCLGQDDAVDLRAVLRAGATDAELREAIRQAVARKPERHDFVIAERSAPAVARHMSTTGG
jgi:cyclic pyranopterin phosphate synthase